MLSQLKNLFTYGVNSQISEEQLSQKEKAKLEPPTASTNASFEGKSIGSFYLDYEKEVESIVK